MTSVNSNYPRDIVVKFRSKVIPIWVRCLPTIALVLGLHFTANVKEPMGASRFIGTPV